jgi:AraC-like DNA-binding protein
MLCYWLAQWHLLNRQKNTNIPQRVNWLTWLLYTELLIFAPAIVALLFGKKDLYNLIGNFSGLVGVLIQGYVLLMKPEILYGFPSEPYIPQPVREEMPEEMHAELREHKQLEPEMVEVIRNGLAHLMDDHQRFRKADLKIFHIAEEMGVPPYKLSAFFKEVEKQNFVEYVNQRRIAYCISRIQSGEARSKTLEALSLESGFNTRSTFIRAFKKVTGKIPSAFMEEAV